MTERDLKHLRKIVLDAMVKQDAWTFLYDAGFSPSRKENPASRKKERSFRKKDRMLGMLDAWCEATGRSLCQVEEMTSSNTLTDEERQMSE